MTVLYLGPTRPAFEAFLQERCDHVIRTEEALDLRRLDAQAIQLVVSYGYRHKISPEILRAFPQKIINLHISFLPWNRGADPNPWSFLEDSPKGVSIHLMDQGIDTGPLLVQKPVPWFPDDTLRTTYHRLSETIEKLCRESWPEIST